MKNTKPLRSIPVVNSVIDSRLKQLELEGKTRTSIAREAGFPRPQGLSMITGGNMPVPVARIPGLAKALDLDPMHLFRLKMLEEWSSEPALISLLRSLGTTRETEIIEFIRHASENSNPALTRELKDAIRGVLVKPGTSKASH